MQQIPEKFSKKFSKKLPTNTRNSTEIKFTSKQKEYKVNNLPDQK